MRRATSFVYCPYLCCCSVSSFVVVLYLSSGWFCRREIWEVLRFMRLWRYSLAASFKDNLPLGSFTGIDIITVYIFNTLCVLNPQNTYMPVYTYFKLTGMYYMILFAFH